jgi:hypothetical protein
MPDWYTRHFSLRGKRGGDRRSAVLKYLALLMIVDVVIVVITVVVVGEPLLDTLVYAAVATVIGLFGLALEVLFG